MATMPISSAESFQLPVFNRLYLRPDRQAMKAFLPWCNLPAERASRFSFLNHELRSALAKYVFGENTVDVTAIIAVCNVEPWPAFLRLFLAR